MLKDEKAEEGQPQWVMFIASRPEKPKADGNASAVPASESPRQSGSNGRPFDDDLPPFMR